MGKPSSTDHAVESVSAEDVLKQLARHHFESRPQPYLDVRSEGEYTDSCIPGFSNVPILTNDERHQVGLCYKKQGQEAAIALGHQLVDPARDERVKRWMELAQNGEVVVTCWRGGLRSKLACQWLSEAGVHAFQVQGGTKALRARLLDELNTYPPLTVLSGVTGSGKTRLLQVLPRSQVLDLEKLARHKGSSFGRHMSTPQPRQTAFENAVALHLMAFRAHERGSLIVEDESSPIGSVGLPVGLKDQMRISPVVLLRVDTDQRAQNVYEEYVLEPLQLGFSHDQVLEHLEKSLHRIERKLGGLRTQQIGGFLKHAFSRTEFPAQIPEAHREWIIPLLLEYYDKLYEFAWSRFPRKVIHEGDFESCRQFLTAPSV